MRQNIRGLAYFGRVRLSHTLINETALGRVVFWTAGRFKLKKATVDVFGRQIAFGCEADPHQGPPEELGV